MKKRFLTVLPLILAGGLALTGCGSVDVGIHVKNQDSADVKVTVEGSKTEMDQLLSQSSSGSSAAGVTAGLFLDSTVSQARQSVAAPGSYHFSESNKGDVQKAEASLDDVALGDLPTLAMQSTVAYDSDRYTFTGVRPADATLGKTSTSSEMVPVTLSVTFPQAVESASADGEVQGNTVTWDVTSMKAEQTFTAVTAGPGLAWWASLLIWLAGTAAVVLLACIAFMSGRKDGRSGTEDPKAA